VLHRPQRQPLLKRRPPLVIECAEPGTGPRRSQVIAACLPPRAVHHQVVGVGLELLAQRQQRRLGQLRQRVGHEPQPPQRAQQRGRAELRVAAVRERPAQIIRLQLEEPLDVLRARQRRERAQLVALRCRRPAGHQKSISIRSIAASRSEVEGRL
jgi:hypothetical protein